MARALGGAPPPVRARDEAAPPSPAVAAALFPFFLFEGRETTSSTSIVSPCAANAEKPAGSPPIDATTAARYRRAPPPPPYDDEEVGRVVPGRVSPPRRWRNETAGSPRTARTSTDTPGRDVTPGRRQLAVQKTRAAPRPGPAPRSPAPHAPPSGVEGPAIFECAGCPRAASSRSDAAPSAAPPPPPPPPPPTAGRRARRSRTLDPDQVVLGSRSGRSCASTTCTVLPRPDYLVADHAAAISCRQAIARASHNSRHGACRL
jgi:hypothetical protein